MNLRHALRLVVCVAVVFAFTATAPAADRYLDFVNGGTVWDNSSTSNWSTVSGGPYTSVFGSGNDAIFEGTGGTVNVSAVDANSLYFMANGYNLSTGQITIGDPGSMITVDPGITATIGSIITKTSGAPLAKAGDGTLILSGANTYTVGTNVDAGTLQINSTNALPAGTVDIDAGARLTLLSANTNWNANGTTITGDGTVELQFQSIGASNTYLSNITGFNGTVELTKSSATTGDKWNAGNINAPNASVLINPGTQIYVTGTDTFEGISVLGTGNTENRGAIRLAGTVNAPVTLLGDATIGAEGGHINGDISLGVAGAHVLTLGTGNSNNMAGNMLNGVISDGAGTLTVNVYNNNSGNVFIPGTAANTYSGGTLLMNGPGSGTRLTIGAISGTPYGSGPITIGQSATGRAGIFFNGAASNQTLANDIIVNTALGTDRPGIRADATNVTLSGTITANLADATFSTNGTGTFNLTGQVTGPAGLLLHNQYGSNVTVTLNNTTANPNDYQGDTTIQGTKGTIVLGAAEQIPNGAGAGNLVNNGKLNMNGFSETINGLSGTGAINGISGTPTLTVGDNDTTSTFSGTINDAGGTLSLVKIGTGMITLTGQNNYTGTTSIDGGTLVFDNTSGGAYTYHGSDILVNNGSTFKVTASTGNDQYWFNGKNFIFDANGGGTIDTSGRLNFVVYGGSTFSTNGGAQDQIIGTAGINLHAGHILNYDVADGSDTVDLLVSAPMWNGGGIIKTGAGTMQLSTVNTYTGGTTVNEGVLDLARPGNSGTGTIRGTVTVNQGATLRLSTTNTLGWTGGQKVNTLNINGGLVDNVAGGDNGWGITINMTGGELRSNGGVSSNTGQYYSLGGGSSINTFASADTATIAGRINLRESNPGNALSINVADGPAAVDLLVTAAITQQGGARNLTKTGPGTMKMEGQAYYTGNTLVSGGTLSLTDGGKLYMNGGGGNYNITVNGGGVLELDDYRWDGSLGKLWYSSNNITLDNGTMRFVGTTATGSNGRGFGIGAGGATLESAVAGETWNIYDHADSHSIISNSGGTLTLTGDGDGILGKALPGTGGLVKNGTGTWTLNGAGGNNGYTGTTTVNDGVLAVGGSFGGDGGIRGDITVNNGGTFQLLQSNIIINNSLVTIGSGGTFNTSGNSDVIGGLTGDGNIIGGGTLTLDLVQGQVTTFSGTIDGVSIGVRGYNSNGSNAKQVLTGTATGLGSLFVQRGNSANDTSILELAGNGSTTTSFVGVGQTGGGQGQAILNIVDNHTLDAGNFFLGEQNGQAGTVNQSGGTVNVTGQIRIGHWPNESSVYNLTGGKLDSTGGLYVGWDGNGLLDISGNAQLEVNDVFIQRNSTVRIGGNAVVTPNAGGNWWRIGDNRGTGTLIVEGNADVTADFFSIGDVNGTGGTVTQNGGTIHINNRVMVGHWPNNTSTYNMNGGELILTGTPSGGTEQAGILYLGIDGTGIFNHTGGDVTAAGLRLDNRGNTGGTDTYTMTGGTLTLGSYGIQANDSTQINLGGGTILASANWNSPRPMTLTGDNGDVTFAPDAPYSITLDGILSGPGGLIKDGTGTLRLTQSNNNYTGGTNVINGTLELVGQNNSGSTVGTGDIRIGPNGTVTGLSHNVFGHTNDANIPNVIIDGGTLNPPAYLHVKSIEMTGGTITNYGGTGGSGLDWRHGINTLKTNANATSATVAAKNTIGGTWTVDVADGTAADDLIISGQIVGGGSLLKTGDGKLVFAGNKDYNGATTVDGGILQLNNTLRNSASITVNPGANLHVGGTNTFTPNHGTAEVASQVITINGGTWTNTAGRENRIGNVNLNDGATWTLSGYSSNWGIYYLGAVSGGAEATVAVGGSSPSVIDGNGNLKLGTNTVFDVADVTSDNNTDLSVSAILDDQVSPGFNPGGFTKTGAGTMTLTGTNIYTGPTSVNAGTLQVGAAGTGSIDSPTAINNGGTLAGTGVVNNAITVNPGGTVSPGDQSGGAIGTLTVDAATFTPGSTLAIQLDPSSPGNFTPTGWGGVAQAAASDTLDVTGLLDLGESTLDLSALDNSWARGQEFNILDFDLALNDADGDGEIDTHFGEYIIPNLYSDDYTTITHDELISGQFLPDLGETGEGLGGLLAWDFTDLYTQGIIRIVPEPGTWLVSLTGLLALGWFTRRRKRRSTK